MIMGISLISLSSSFSVIYSPYLTSSVVPSVVFSSLLIILSPASLIYVSFSGYIIQIHLLSSLISLSPSFPLWFSHHLHLSVVCQRKNHSSWERQEKNEKVVVARIFICLRPIFLVQHIIHHLLLLAFFLAFYWCKTQIDSFVCLFVRLSVCLFLYTSIWNVCYVLYGRRLVCVYFLFSKRRLFMLLSLLPFFNLFSIFLHKTSSFLFLSFYLSLFVSLISF